MKINALLDRVAKLDRTIPTDGMIVPEPEVVAFHVVTTRRLMNLKKSALASMAGISLSTIERVERGESVSTECLDKLAVALENEPGYFTAPRRRLSHEEVAQQLSDSYGHLEIVQVRPFRTQLQVRKLMRCDGYLNKQAEPR